MPDNESTQPTENLPNGIWMLYASIMCALVSIVLFGVSQWLYQNDSQRMARLYAEFNQRISHNDSDANSLEESDRLNRAEVDSFSDDFVKLFTQSRTEKIVETSREILFTLSLIFVGLFSWRASLNPQDSSTTP